MLESQRSRGNWCAIRAPAEYVSAVVRTIGPPAPEAALRKIVQEIQQRTVWQCLGIYLVGSWIALQVVDVLKDNMGLPDWVFPFAVVLLILGLPVVLATAIIQERLPGQGGEDDRRRSARVAAARARAEEIVRARG